MKEKYHFEFDVYNSIDDLSAEDASLLKQARETTATAYAPYSKFFVGAAAVLGNDKIVTGTNQENGSFPVSICAERALMAGAASLYPNESIHTMAISYHNHNKNTTSNTPISPCGMCRQALIEFEQRHQQPIRLILSGMMGKVYIIPQANLLLPLGFKGEQLGI